MLGRARKTDAERDGERRGESERSERGDGGLETEAVKDRESGMGEGGGETHRMT